MEKSRIQRCTSNLELEVTRRTGKHHNCKTLPKQNCLNTTCAAEIVGFCCWAIESTENARLELACKIGGSLLNVTAFNKSLRQLCEKDYICTAPCSVFHPTPLKTTTGYYKHEDFW